MVCLQEARGSRYDLNSMGREFGEHSHFGTFCGNAAAGGIVTSIGGELLRMFTRMKLQVLLGGRISALWCYKDQGRPMAIANLHMVLELPHSKKVHFLRLLARGLPLPHEGLAIMCGDWIFPAAGEVRMDLSSGMPVEAPNPLGEGELSEDAFDDWTEVEQEDPTRRQMRDGELVGNSRIDRICINTPTHELLDRRARAATYSRVDSLRCLLTMSLCWPPSLRRLVAPLLARCFPDGLQGTWIYRSC